MKIRIKDNSVRLRLSRTEVERFGKEGYLEERTDFGSSAFVYALESAAGINELSANFNGGKMTVQVPAAMAGEWTTTEQIGYSHNMDTGNGGQLFLLIEKDFKCIDNSTEDQSDNYEHPAPNCA